MAKEKIKSEIDLRFTDWVEKIEGNLGKEEWVVVYMSKKNDYEWTTFYCALIPNNKIKQSLERVSWDLRIGNGFPGFAFSLKDGKEIAKYLRYSEPDVEPLVFHRNFHGIKEGYKEISEEFRHYFNLYEESKNNKFIAIHDDGDEEDIILMSNDVIRIKLKFLKEFLAVKKKHLAIFFDLHRFSTKSIEELQIEESNEKIREDAYVYSLIVRNFSFSGGHKNIRSQGRLVGKKLIAGLKDFVPRLFEEKKEYEDFIIDVDEDGKEILYSCNREGLSNNFGENPNSSHYLTPVFFKREVLNDYYSNPDKYSVEDGYLRCSGLWGLPMDNNHHKYVIVYLGDLGQWLSIKEQRRWKRFNITPQGRRISRTAWERNFKAEFADPEMSDLSFKQKFKVFQGKWNKRFGWKLFRPLMREDEHHFKTLRVPLTNEQKEFDEQVLSLTKILIDSLNEKELQKGIIKKEKGIDKLEAFFYSKNVHFDGLIKFLRDLQELRSTGVAHLKGKKYSKIKKVFSIEEKELSEVFDDILIKAIWTLDSLEDHFLENIKA